MASDLNGDALTYSASNLPPGITFKASTRTFSGTPTSTGTWTVTYKASDPHGASVSKTFTITVSATAPKPPMYNGGIGTIFFNAGTSNSWTVPSTAFTNPTGRALSYSITKSDGTALPSIYHFNASTGTLTATIPGHRATRRYRSRSPRSIRPTTCHHLRFPPRSTSPATWATTRCRRGAR